MDSDFPAGIIVRSNLPALNGTSAVRSKTQRRMTNKISHPPGGVSKVDTFQKTKGAAQSWGTLWRT
nr:MAG TPA: hypothetical protein [Caudoviricetes sp.]